MAKPYVNYPGRAKYHYRGMAAMPFQKHRKSCNMVKSEITFRIFGGFPYVIALLLCIWSDMNAVRMSSCGPEDLGSNPCLAKSK